MISPHFFMPMLDEPTYDVRMSLNECHHVRIARGFLDANAFVCIRNLHADLIGVAKYFPKQWVAQVDTTPRHDSRVHGGDVGLYSRRNIGSVGFRNCLHSVWQPSDRPSDLSPAVKKKLKDLLVFQKTWIVPLNAALSPSVSRVT